MNANARFLILAIVVTLIAAFLRFSHITTMNPYIEDLSARLGILTLDFHRGIHHFPYAPYQFEFDETGSSYVAYIWTILFGNDWSSFQFYGAFFGVLLTLSVVVFSRCFYNERTAWISGLFVATNPALLTWDRYPAYASSHILSILIMLVWAILLVRPTVPRSSLRVLLAGVVFGLGLFVTNLVNLALPATLTACGCNLGRARQLQSIRRRGNNFLMFFAGMAITSIPILIAYKQFSWYVLWRVKHFETFMQSSEPITWLLSQMGFIIGQIGWRAQDCLFQSSGSPLLQPIETLLLLAGIVAGVMCRRKPRYRLIPLYFLVWLGVIAVVKTGPWSCTYFSLIVPFLLIQAGVGGDWMVRGIRVAIRHSICRRWISSVIMTSVLVSSVLAARSFMDGSRKLIPGNSLLTDLHYDLAEVPDLPHLFSSTIHEVYHFHYPFWYATRSRLTRVSIVDWDDTGWYSHPDHLPLKIEKSDSPSCCFIVDSPHAAAFRERFGEWITEDLPIRLERSGLWSFPCTVTLPEVLRRTWTETAIPDMLDIATVTRSN